MLLSTIGDIQELGIHACHVPTLCNSGIVVRLENCLSCLPIGYRWAVLGIVTATLAVHTVLIPSNVPKRMLFNGRGAVCGRGTNNCWVA
ncbi:hypothetical protein L596_010496 [Steinernema carpocapsae]|uniref:Uncharacterized protein n=1 Tax=Steinernema carpocapsae TaxID=34508 RepID=A0A4U5PJ30_STECR|nr:hypothetical protein L596_010496 [Steinernema carpocapsae]